MSVIKRVKHVPETGDFTFETKNSIAHIGVTNRGDHGGVEVTVNGQIMHPADLRQAAKLFLRLADDLEVESSL